MTPRELASERGEISFIPDTPCKRGHLSRRNTRWGNCTACVRLHTAQAYHSVGGREKARQRALKSKYGLSQEAYENRLAAQGGKCAICLENFRGGSRGFKTPCVDHSHSSGTVRGILCNHCNRGLGMFRDRPDLLVEAAEYLNRYPS